MISDVQRAADFLQAIAEPTRLRVLKILAEGPATPTSLAGSLGITQCNISHHLTKMRQQGIIDSKRQGRTILYFLTATAIAAYPTTFAVLKFGDYELRVQKTGSTN